MTRICPDHNSKLEYRNTRYGPLYVCTVDGCDVRCWGGSTSTPANQATRDLRHQLHKQFDPTWEDEHGPFSHGQRKNKRGVRRHRAYQWLAEQMGLPFDQTHFGMFDAEQCEIARTHVEAAVKAHEYGTSLQTRLKALREAHQ